jgi:polysaccharide deacetylase 2 family uncharacterized protein YibQ
MTKLAKRRRSKKRRPDFFIKNRRLLLIMGVTGLLVAGLALFARMDVPPQPSVAPPSKMPAVDYTKIVHAEIEAFLAGLGVAPGSVQRDLDQLPARYTIVGDFPDTHPVVGFRERLQQIPGDYVVQLREANSIVVSQSRQVKIIIHFIPPISDFPPGPLLAIIMDDLGRSTSTAKELITLAQPVTFAILPDEPQAVKVAEMAYDAGREVMLHAPMEPQGYPAVNPGSDALFVKNSDAEIRHNFDQLLARVPHAKGTNNHMGSRFTEDARALAPVMESLHEKNMFFIDSRTTGHSRVPEVADSFGVPTMNRDVFLDNVAEVKAISSEIRRLEGKARNKGMAIGICHPYPETLEALKRELPGLVERGVTIVPVSVLLKKKAVLQGN